MSGHVVVAPLVLARNKAGAFDYLYKGAVVGELADGELKRLKEGKFVEAVGSAAVPSTPPGPQEPAGNASVEAWQEYARSKGATDADLEGVARDELRARFASK